MVMKRQKTGEYAHVTFKRSGTVNGRNAGRPGTPRDVRAGTQ
jgi:hypothetical protein